MQTLFFLKSFEQWRIMNSFISVANFNERHAFETYLCRNIGLRVCIRKYESESEGNIVRIRNTASDNIFYFFTKSHLE
jgi:hypothetical protein